MTTGPYLGAVTATGFTVMVRINDPFARAKLVYDCDSDLVDGYRTKPYYPGVGTDYTLHIPIDVSFCTGGVAYYKISGQPGVYEVRLAPPPGSPFCFVLVSDSRGNDVEPVPAYSMAAEEGCPVVGQIGDFRHNNPGENPVIESWRKNNRKALGIVTSGIDFFTAFGRDVNFFHTWDDHDYACDNCDGTYPYKDLALTAFLEYFTTYPLPGEGIYHSFTWGDAEFFVLDTRYFRDWQGDPDGPDKTLLGAEQKQWLKDGLLASTATWKFIITSSKWNPTGKTNDNWVQYQTEQRELIDFIQSNGIANLVFFSGDIHSGGGIDDGTFATFPEMTVPTTNVPQDGKCTGADGCGRWSEGVITPTLESPGGYGLVTVSPDSVTLEAKDTNGFVRVSYVVWRED